METLTRIDLTESEARLFILYQKYHAFMKLLESVGAFDLKSGSIFIHFDAQGAIGSVEVKKFYKI